MNFQEWLLMQGSSKSTVKHYVGAVYSKLTDFSIELGLPSLRDIQDPIELGEIIDVIKANPEFIHFNTVGNRMYSCALNKFALYRASVDESQLVNQDLKEINDLPISTTEKEVLTKARIGQGKYRKGLLQLWDGVCSVTEYPDPQFLIASHIKPWHAASSLERLDPFNGLLLTPNLDKAFDAGYISFDPKNRGKIIFSTAFLEPQELGISDTMKLTHLDSQTAHYLEYHKRNVLIRY